MSTTSNASLAGSSADNKTFMSVVLPYLLATLSQVPMLLLYFREVLGQPHYGFLPIALIAFGVLIFWRWPSNRTDVIRKSTLANVLLSFAVMFGLAAFLYRDYWFSAVCVYFLLGSFLSRINDQETGGSLFPISFVFLILVKPPGRFDQTLITWLQQVSARITSQLLDLVGYAHYMPGTVIQAPHGAQFGIEEACSGVQSFFTLLFVAVLYVVYFRRPWFRATLLVTSVVFWAIFMNTLRIFAIPIADRVAGLDLSHGLSHDVLGYFALIAGMVMVYSTDQFLLFLLGPTEDFGDEGDGVMRSVSRFWNKYISGAESGKKKKKSTRGLAKPIKIFVWAATCILCLAGLFNLSDVFLFLSKSGSRVLSFDANAATPLQESDLESEIDGWRQVNHFSEDRVRGSDLGQYSDVWRFVTQQYQAVASFDQTFPGWHELTTCYRNQGWKVGTRIRRQDPAVEAGETEDGWQFVMVDLRNDIGQHGFLVFSMFDRDGFPYEPPGKWSMIEYLANGLSNRLNSKIRSQLFRGEAYQTQVFVQSYREFDEERKQEIIEHFLKIREQMREGFLKKRDLNSASAVTSDSEADSQT
ncbi:MAG: exosortase U [Pirellulaceae bacterium]